MSAETSHVFISFGHGHAALVLHSLQSQSKELKYLCYFCSHEFLSFIVQHFCSFSLLLISNSGSSLCSHYANNFIVPTTLALRVPLSSPPLVLSPEGLTDRIHTLDPFWTDFSFFFLSFCCSLNKNISFSAMAFTLFIIQRDHLPCF